MRGHAAVGAHLVWLTRCATGFRCTLDAPGGPTPGARGNVDDARPPTSEAATTGDPALRELTVRALAGDRDAAAGIYARFHTTVLAIQLGNTGGDRQLAADLTQDTFVKALYRLDQFEWQGPASLRGWIATIARNTFRDHVRSAAERHHGGNEVPDRPDSDDAMDPAVIAERDLPGVREQAGRLLDGLKPEHQVVLRRMVGDGASAAELAAELDRTEAAIHQLKRRAMDAARRSAASMSASASARSP
jgi:RNA polymerase sigma-70 factor, ECF subfamily